MVEVVMRGNSVDGTDKKFLLGRLLCHNGAESDVNTSNK